MFPVDGYIRPTDKGRGVFASHVYKKGVIIEIAPVIPLHEFRTLPKAIKQVVFSLEHLTKNPPDNLGLVLGWGSMYNHANPANMIFKMEDGNMHFIAAVDIPQNDELTINYDPKGGSNVSTSSVWFDKLNIKELE